MTSRIPPRALDPAGATAGQVPTVGASKVEWANPPALGSIDGLSDVDTTTTPPTDRQGLRWNAASGLWLPATFAAADISYAGSTGLAATNVESALDELDAEKLPAARSRARAKRTTPPADLAHATATVVVFEAEEYDTDTLWAASPDPSRLLLTKIGLWMVFGLYAFGGGSDVGRRNSSLRLNGSLIVGRGATYPSTTTTTAVYVPVSAPVVATATTDYVELVVYQDSGAARPHAAGTESDMWLAAAYLGP